MNLQSGERLKLLQEAIAGGIIDEGSVLDAIMKIRREQILKIHPYAITPPKQKNGRWQTWYKDSKGKMKNIKAQTEADLLDKLVSVYKAELNLEKMTFYKLYEEWLEYKTPMASSLNTIKRHRQHYKKYFESSKLHSMRIDKIDTLILETECNRIVKEFNLSRKDWVNAKTILNGMFEYAKRKKYIDENPILDMKIMVKYRQVVKKTGSTQTYNTDELENLNRYLDAMYEETEDASFLAVRLNFYLGLRVGELVALKPEDISENHVHVIREEVRNQEDNVYCVVEHTKTHDDRFVVLIPKAKAILEKLDKSGTYLFERNGERLTARQIAYVLEKYAERQGVATKSTHKMRKTYASRLNASGVPLDAIREQLGHADLATTLSYIYNPLTDKETYDLISNAL